MKKLVPLLALSVTACAPDLLDRDLKDIPGLSLHAPYDGSHTAYETAVLQYDGDDSDEGPCYRIPEETSLTVNGQLFIPRKRGDVSEGINGTFSCDLPRFEGPPTQSGLPLTEYVLSDGKSTLRASFKQLLAERGFRVKVNGAEKTSIRNGQTIDIEWLPVSDRLEGAEVTFEQEGGETPFTYTVPTTSLDANHIRFILASPRTGTFKVNVIGRGQAGVEVCEGFSACRADFIDELQLPITIE